MADKKNGLIVGIDLREDVYKRQVFDKRKRGADSMGKAIVGANWGDEGKGKITDLSLIHI